jgi:hypothetical protein
MSGSLAPDLAGAVELLARDLPGPGARANALCAVAPFAAGPGALRAEVLEIGIRPSICLAVLATGWPDESDIPAVWRRTVEGTVWLLDPEDLGAALTRSPPDVRRHAVDLMADSIESLPAKHQFFIFRTMAVLPRHATDEQMMRLAHLAHRVSDMHEWARVATPLLQHTRPEAREALTHSG